MRQRGVASGQRLEFGCRREVLHGDLHIRTADALTLSIRKKLNIILYHHNLPLSHCRTALSDAAKIQHVDGRLHLLKIGNVGTLSPKGAGCYANWRRHLHQLAETCTPYGGDVYAICRKHADLMTKVPSEAYHRRPKRMGSRGGKSTRHQKRRFRLRQCVIPKLRKEVYN